MFYVTRNEAWYERKSTIAVFFLSFGFFYVHICLTFQNLLGIPNFSNLYKSTYYINDNGSTPDLSSIAIGF